MRRVVVFACLCLAGLPPAWAGLTLSTSWQQDRQRDTGLPSSGYGAGLSVDLGPWFFVGGGYSQMRTESFEDALDGVEGRLEYRSGGVDLGVAWPWTDTFGATVTGGYSASEVRGLDGFEDDRAESSHGPTGSLTLWWQPSSILAFNVGRGYSYIAAVPGWDTSAGAGLRLWGQTWLDAGYWRGDGIEGWTAGLRTTFAGD